MFINYKIKVYYMPAPVTLFNPKRKRFLEKALVDFFDKNNGKHFSAKQLFLGLSIAGYSISPASIYRLLKVLENKKKIQKMITKNGVCIYEKTNDKPHDHIICLRCSKTIPLYSEKVDNIIKDVIENNGVSIEGRELNIYVTCFGGECRVTDKNNI